MSRTGLLLSLFVVGLLVQGGLCSSKRSRSSIANDDESSGLQKKPMPFKAGNEYYFQYNGQIASGLIGPNDLNEQSSSYSQSNYEKEDSNPQKAVTRLQATTKISFVSENRAVLELQQPRVGQLNSKAAADPKRVQPMAFFDVKQINAEKLDELKLPCEFLYSDGVVERINFHRDDSSWSKNVKRAVLNLIQLNLKRKGVDMKHQQGSRSNDWDSSSNEMQASDNEKQQKFGKAFVVPETSVEGICLTTYTINENANEYGSNNNNYDNKNELAGESEWNAESSFNVTKSINFKNCRQIADVAYGFQSQDEQNAKCARNINNIINNNYKNGKEYQGNQFEFNRDESCDPKEVNEDKLERSTVQRVECAGPTSEKTCAIMRAEVLSHYVFKNFNAETDSRTASAMHTIAVSELIFRGVKSAKNPTKTAHFQLRDTDANSGKLSSSLLYDNEWELLEKRFYMFGDEQFNADNSPFKAVNKVEQSQMIYRRLIQASINTADGIEGEVAGQLQRLVELLRMCGVDELNQIQSAITNAQKQHGQQSRGEAEKIASLFADTLAIAGTRNNVHVLVQKILNGQLSAYKAAHALKNLNRVPAPSESIASAVEELCKSELAHRSAALQQSCWLTYGAMVGKICRDKISIKAQQQEQQNWQQLQKQQSGEQQQQQLLFGTQSGFDSAHLCAPKKKDHYKKVLFKQFQDAETTYDKVLALKAIGNAGLDNSVYEIEKIALAQGADTSPVVRATAIDALRRLRAQMPRKIQRILLPIFQDTKERPEVRMIAFSTLMSSQPEEAILDQLLYTLTKERSRQVQSFVYSTMKTLSESKIERDQTIAKHLKSALKMSGIDEEEVKRGSVNMQMHLHATADQNQGAALKWRAVFSEKQMLPAHLAAGIDTIFNGKQNLDSVKLSLTQQGTNRWLENVIDALLRNEQNSAKVRSQRSEATNSQRADHQLRDIFASLGVKSRKNQNQEQSKNAFAMLNLRIADVDHAVLPLDEQTLPLPLRKILEESERAPLDIVLRHLATAIGNHHIRSLNAMNFGEKTATIPTSAGVPLKIAHAMPVLTAIDASAKMINDAQNVESSTIKTQLNARVIITGVHLQKMEVWTPFGSSGVESTRAVEINAPLKAEIEFGAPQESDESRPMSGIKFVWWVPKEQKTRLFGAHTAAFTYTRDYKMAKNSQKMQRTTPKLLAIRNPSVEASLGPIVEMNEIFGVETFGMPIRVSGDYRKPNQPTDLAKWLQIVMATENHIHVTLTPNADTPRTIVFHASSALFQSTSAQKLNDALGQLENFYDNAEDHFHPAYPEDFQGMQMDSISESRQKHLKSIQNFRQKYTSKGAENAKTQNGEMPVYKHSVKFSVKTEGGKKIVRAALKLDAVCDARFKTCAIFNEIERSPMTHERQPWMLKASAHFLRPETVSSVEELERLGSAKQQKFLAKLSAQWGSDYSHDVNIRLRGENVQLKKNSERLSQWRENAVQHKTKRDTAFINNFQAVVDYNIQLDGQNVFEHIFDAIKARNFWNTHTNLKQSGKNGQIYANLFIEPSSASYANLQVRTPTQTVRIQGLGLPTSMRPMPLVHAGHKSTHSVAQVIKRYSRQSTNAECLVDGRRVETFDGLRYKGPITSSCYSVLAKDCANQDQPQFAVLMKSLSQDGKQKKIKVITPDNVVECQAKDSNNGQQSRKIVCKINGQTVTQQSSRVPAWGVSGSSFEESTEQFHPIVEYNNDEQTSVTINAPSGAVSVRFGCWCGDCACQNARIQLANKHKYGQCGLCGHYDDTAADEWRMSNNENTDDLAAFHRSYSVLNNNDNENDGEECSQSSQDNFYESNKNKFALSSESEKWERSSNDSDEDEAYSSAEEESSYGGYAQEDRSDEPEHYGLRKRSVLDQIAPITRTYVIEHENQVCFSAKPLKSCPMHTVPADAMDESKLVKVNFVCMPRWESLPYFRTALEGKIVDLAGKQPNFTSEVPEPTNCAPLITFIVRPN